MQRKDKNTHTTAVGKKIDNLAKKQKKEYATGKRCAIQTCLVPNPHGKPGYAGFPDVCAMLPDVVIAG